MLIRFTIENFLSFKEKNSFSMIPNRSRMMTDHKNMPVNGISTLKTGVIYGANASGKSNLAKAIAFGRFMVLRGYPSDETIDYPTYTLDKTTQNASSMIEYEIQTNGKNYAYGFSFNKVRILNEWLYEIDRKGQKCVFERDNQRQLLDLSFILEKNRQEEERKFIEIIAKSTPDNQLCLHELSSKKVKENVGDISDISNVFNWFRNVLTVIFPDDKYKEGILSEIADKEDVHLMFESLLSYFDTGVDGVKLEDVDINSVPVPKTIIEQIRKELLNTKAEERRSILSTPDFTFFFTKKNNDIQVQKFMTKHKVTGSRTPIFFDTKDESDGTNRMIDFIPLIMDLLKGNNVFVIDEMERSLHPNLIYDIFDLYLSCSHKVNSQLIVSTHESNLLTKDLLRKDEIWFLTKDSNGSHLYSLDEYDVKFDVNIRKDYLLGRYKGVPNLGNRDSLTFIKE